MTGKVLWTTVIVIAWVFGLKLYGLHALIFAWMFASSLWLVDVALGSYIAKRFTITASKLGRDGLVSKLLLWFLTGAFVGFVWVMAYFADNDAATKWASVISRCVIGFYSMTELISLVENMQVITSGRVKTFLMAFGKILGIAYDYAEIKLQKKIEDVTGIKIELKQPIAEVTTTTAVTTQVKTKI